MKKNIIYLITLLVTIVIFVGGSYKLKKDINTYEQSNEMAVNILEMGIGGHTSVESKICGIKVTTNYDVKDGYIYKTVNWFD